MRSLPILEYTTPQISFTEKLLKKFLDDALPNAPKRILAVSRSCPGRVSLNGSATEVNVSGTVDCYKGVGEED